MKSWLVSLALVALASSHAAADNLYADPNDPGRVTAIGRGVKEIDLGGLFILTHNKSGDGEGTTRVSSLGGASFQYFLKDNLSVGGTALFNYDRISSTTSATAFGGMAFASLHVRLGLGAFLRPTFGGGLLVGKQQTELTPGTSTSANQLAGIVRLALPFAYFPSRRIVLQAGPELNLTLGTTSPDGADSETFVTISGGFGLSAGYVF